MKPTIVATGYDIYFRASQSRVHRAHPAVRRAHGQHTRRVPLRKQFDIPDEQMPEPPVVPKDEKKIFY